MMLVLLAWLSIAGKFWITEDACSDFGVNIVEHLLVHVLLGGSSVYILLFQQFDFQFCS